ncbi:hypothetical protein EDM76_10995 [bacterium]|nr:MAG: hypothetical protein EDM76_10995 [bacterium]MCL4232678.1 phosphotransferase [Dehalococcoidia bacterium]
MSLSQENGLAPAARLVDQEDLDALQEFIDEGVVTRVLGVVKAGKEATVYRCGTRFPGGPPFAAVKVYRGASFRDFKNSAIYLEGQAIGNGQARRAIEKKTAAGREIAASMWVNREFDVLSELHSGGADVPEPFFATDRAILMAFAGSDAAAPQLQHARFDRPAASAMLDRLLWNIETFLDHHLVHGDLSPYNVLVEGARPLVIDFPQAVDPRKNPNARGLLERDVRNICRHFARYGLEPDAERFVAGLWRRYRVGELGTYAGLP